MSDSPGSRTAATCIFIFVAASIVAIDLWSKKAIFELLKVLSVGAPPHVADQERYVIVPKWFELEANYNYGAFSGWFAEHPIVLASVSVIALVVIAGILVHHVYQPKGPSLLFAIALGLLWGGTCGNLYDRVTLRAVRDWIKWFYVSADGHEHVWPNFNIADSAICTGVGLLVLLEVVSGLRQRKQVERAA
jgi:signal peptidase II